jgi:hypothetical protein
MTKKTQYLIWQVMGAVLILLIVLGYWWYPKWQYRKAMTRVLIQFSDFENAFMPTPSQSISYQDYTRKLAALQQSVDIFKQRYPPEQLAPWQKDYLALREEALQHYGVVEKLWRDKIAASKGMKGKVPAPLTMEADFNFNSVAATAKKKPVGKQATMQLKIVVDQMQIELTQAGQANSRAAYYFQNN